MLNIIVLLRIFNDLNSRIQIYCKKPINHSFLINQKGNSRVYTNFQVVFIGFFLIKQTLRKNDKHRLKNKCFIIESH